MPFLKPTGVERPDDISRCVWDSEVRAPIAVQAMVAVVLRRDGIERLGPGGAAELVHLEQEAPRPLHPLVDAEGVVHARVVDDPFQPVEVRGFSK